MHCIHAGIKQGLAAMIIAATMLWAQAASAADQPIDYKELATMPVFHMGMLKSFHTFAHEEVKSLTGRSQYKDHEPLEMTLSLIFEPSRWMDEPMIKVENIELRKLLGGKLITPRQLFAPEKTAGIKELFDRDEKMKNAINVLFYQGNTAVDLAHSWSIIPVRTPVGELSYVSPHEFAEFKGRVSLRQQSIFAAAQGMEAAWKAGDGAQFNAHVLDIKRLLNEELLAQGENPNKVKMDYTYMKLHPFARAGNVYLLALILFGAGYFTSRPGFVKAATGALVVGLAFNVAAMVMRGVVADRLPVSNFYESLTFAIGGVVLFSLFFQMLFGKHLIGAIGAGVGFIFMGVANNLPVRMLRVEPLIPALQSYWLNIHVTTMLLSYAIFAISFVVGLIYVVRHVQLYGFKFRVPLASDSSTLNVKAGETPEDEVNRDNQPSQILVMLDNLNFRLIAVGLAMLTTGVILGAVWADTAWGRPWGWDPKETWAAISWGVYAVFAHLHLFGKWRGLPTVIVSIIGFLCVVFTYVGVSFLLSGLHSYA